MFCPQKRLLNPRLGRCSAFPARVTCSESGAPPSAKTALLSRTWPRAPARPRSLFRPFLASQKWAAPDRRRYRIWVGCGPGLSEKWASDITAHPGRGGQPLPARESISLSLRPSYIRKMLFPSGNTASSITGPPAVGAGLPAREKHRLVSPPILYEEDAFLTGTMASRITASPRWGKDRPLPKVIPMRRSGKGERVKR